MGRVCVCMCVNSILNFLTLTSDNCTGCNRKFLTFSFFWLVCISIQDLMTFLFSFLGISTIEGI